MIGRVVSVNVGVVRSAAWAIHGYTGIDKRPCLGRVSATRLGLPGDSVYGRRPHGGPDRVLYAYAREDAVWWSRELSRDLEPGSFGENLSTEGIDVTNSVIGERWAVGPTVVEVTSPRIPCQTFAGFWNVPDLVKRFTEHGAPGAYLRVIVEGDLGAGDPIEILHRPEHGVTIGVTFRALTNEPELLPLIADVPELPDRVRAKVRSRLEAPIR